MKDSKNRGAGKTVSYGARYTEGYGKKKSVGNPGANVFVQKKAGDFIKGLGSHNSKTPYKGK